MLDKSVPRMRVEIASAFIGEEALATYFVRGMVVPSTSVLRRVYSWVSFVDR